MPSIEKLKPYAKAAIAVAGGVLLVCNAIVADGATVNTVLLAVLTAAGVYRVPNKPKA